MASSADVRPAERSVVRPWDYLAEYREERAEIVAAVERVLESGTLVLGESVAAFERELATRHASPHAVGVDNGTNALSMALQVLGVGPGDDVLTVSNTAAATVVAIDSVGATPVFVDVGEDFLMDPARFAERVTPRSRAVIPVHLYGQSADMSAILATAAAHSLAVVEDCAQATGATHRRRPVGSAGDLAAFSFYPTKVLGGYGDAGAILCRDPVVADRLRRLRFYGMDGCGRVVERRGRNSRLDELHAEILRVRLRRLDEMLAARRAVADRYRQGLADVPGLVLPQVADGNDHVYYMFVVRHPDRDALLRRLSSDGVTLQVAYRDPVHTMPAFRQFAPPGGLPVTERLAREIFSLPTYPGLRREQQDRVIDAVRAAASARVP